MGDRPAGIWLLGATLLLALSAGCAGSGPLRAELRAETKRPAPGAIIFLCDGVAPDLLEQGCREGWLPNIEHRFVRGGATVDNAITVVPAITYAAISSILTGTTPAQHRILGNNWYDPDERYFRQYATIKHYRMVNADLSTDTPTLYELIYPRFSTSVQAAHTRGASENIANWAQSGARWFFRAYTSVDALTAKTVELVAERAKRRGAWPDVLTLYFPGLDSIGHDFGPNSLDYRDGLVNLDHHVGRVCHWLEEQGLLETIYLVFVSDHGMLDTPPETRLDLLALVRDRWGRTAAERVIQDGSDGYRRRFYDRYDTVVGYQDGRSALLYFADPELGWDAPPAPQVVADILHAPDEADRLWNQPGVDLVVWLLNPVLAVVASPRGEGRIEERIGPYGPEYRYAPGRQDPLGYGDDPELAAFVAAGFHSGRDWLLATCDRDFPDVVPQLIPLLREHRSGQVLIAAAPGYSFIPQLGGHGGMLRLDMRVPLMFAGPGISAGLRLECGRTVDVVPTVLTLLGVELPADGSLAGEPLPLTAPLARGGGGMRRLLAEPPAAEADAAAAFTPLGE